MPLIHRLNAGKIINNFNVKICKKVFNFPIVVLSPKFIVDVIADIIKNGVKHESYYTKPLKNYSKLLFKANLIL